MANFQNNLSLVNNRIKNLDLKIYDIPTLIYLAVWIILMLVFWKRIPLVFPFMVCHLVLLSLIFIWMIKPPELKAIKVIRNFYVVPYLFICFGFLNHLIPTVNPNIIDGQLIELDYGLFGQHPSVWLQSSLHPFFTEIFEWSYLSYYFLPLAVPVVLYLSKKNDRISEYLTIVLSAFYLSYFGNLIFPAYGPRFFLAHLYTEPFHGLWLAEGIQHTLNNMEKIQLDAFPSGHAMIIFILMYYTYKHVRKLFWGILPICVALVISTVYLRLHYVVDIVAGLILTIIVIWILKYIFKRFSVEFKTE